MRKEELKDILSKGDESFVLIDIREESEIKESGDKIKEAQNIPMGRLFVEASKGNLPKDKKIVTVCKSGGRCQLVVKELSQKGFDIDYLEGGMNVWNDN